jgi:hypothetical protein
LAGGEPCHRVDANGFQLLALRPADTRDEREAVLGLPLLGATILPPAQSARRYGVGPCVGTFDQEGFELATRVPRVGRHFGKAHGEAAAVTQLEMRRLGRRALHLGDEIAVQAELEHVLRVGLSLQLGVDDLVRPRAQPGRTFDTLEEIAVATPRAVEQGALENDVRSGLHGLERQADRLLEWNAVLRDLHDGAPVGFQLLEEGEFVLVTLLLQQFRLGTVLARLQVANLDQAKIQRRRVTASLEPHQIRSAQA